MDALRVGLFSTSDSEFGETHQPFMAPRSGRRVPAQHTQKRTRALRLMLNIRPIFLHAPSDAADSYSTPAPSSRLHVISTPSPRRLHAIQLRSIHYGMSGSCFLTSRCHRGVKLSGKGGEYSSPVYQRCAPDWGVVYLVSVEGKHSGARCYVWVAMCAGFLVQFRRWPGWVVSRDFRREHP